LAALAFETRPGDIVVRPGDGRVTRTHRLQDCVCRLGRTDPDEVVLGHNLEQSAVDQARRVAAKRVQRISHRVHVGSGFRYHLGPRN